MRIVFLFLERCRTIFWRYCHLRKTLHHFRILASSHRIEGEQHRQEIFSWAPVAKLHVGLGLDSLLHTGTVFHQHILNQVRFYQRVQLRDQDSKGQTSLERTTTLLGAEALKRKFDRLAEKAKNSEDIRLQELEECQAFKWRLSAEDAAAFSGLLKGYLKALSSAIGGHKRTSSNGPTDFWGGCAVTCIQFLSSYHSAHDGIPAAGAKTVPCEASQCDALFLRVFRSREREGSSCLCPRDISELFFVFPRVARRLSQVTKFQRAPTLRIFCNVLFLQDTQFFQVSLR